MGREKNEYGISVAESQTFLLAKRPPAVRSEEKRLFSQATTSETLGKMDSFECSDFWEGVGGEVSVLIGRWYSRQTLTNHK